VTVSEARSSAEEVIASASERAEFSVSLASVCMRARCPGGIGTGLVADGLRVRRGLGEGLAGLRLCDLEQVVDAGAGRAVRVSGLDSAAFFSWALASESSPATWSLARSAAMTWLRASVSALRRESISRRAAGAMRVSTSFFS
jgi:hypothetical protein